MELATDLKLPDWAHSLQFRLTLGFGTMLALTLMIVSGWAAFSTRSAINAYERDLEHFREERTRELVQDVYRADNDMSHVQYSLQQVGKIFSMRLAVVNEAGFVVADSHETPITSKGTYDTEKRRFRDFPFFRTSPLELGESSKSKLVYLPKNLHKDDLDDLPAMIWNKEASQTEIRPSHPFQLSLDATPSTELIESFDTFQSSPVFDIIDEALGDLAIEPQLSALEVSFQKSLLIAGIAGGIAGILIVALFTRSMLSPVNKLSTATTKLGMGEFEHRVDEDRKDELGQLAGTFNAMATQLQEAETNRRRLTADIAHELRTPLTNIRGYLEAIKDGIVEPDEEAIKTLHNETIHLTRLVDDLRLLAIADAGTLRLDLETDRLDAYIETAVEPFRPRALEQGVDLEFEHDGSETLVDFDHTRMSQIVGNLIENALTHTDAGGTVRVRVESAPHDNTVRLMVSDDGCGISEADAEKIFDQFFKADASRARSSGGGLGLTIVKRLVEAHNGEISVESVPDEGSTFSVVLPVTLH